MAKEKKKGGFIADFKAFISRGNVVDMAVGVVIGGAFGKIVTGLVNYIINPCISLLTGGVELDQVKTVLQEAVKEGEEIVKPEVAILWGTWIQTIIDFILVALCIFIVIRAIAKARAIAEAKENAAKAEAEKAAKEKADAEAAEKAAADAEAAAKAAAVQDAILEIRNLMKKN
jgi:large conductance mechanosensitive channel